jgi:hypothetical protein
MSEDAKDDTAAASTDAANSFTPEPTPPQLSAEEVDAIETNTEGTDPDGSIAVPHDTARRALEAVQILVENNRASSDQLESLMSIVLDAAEVANRSASAVATTGGHVNKAAEKLIDGAQRTSAQAKIVLALAGTVLVGCAGVFSFMSVQLQNKVTQLDEMMLAVGKRAVDLKRRMESMDDIYQALEELKLKQENTQSVQQAIEDKISRLADAPRPAAKPEPKPVSEAKPADNKADAKPTAAPKAAVSAPVANPNAEVQAAKKAEAARAERQKAEAARAEVARAEAANKALLEQLGALDGMLKEQSKAVKNLSSQFNKLEGSVANVEGVKKDVEALAEQQKLREKEMAQELAASNAKRDKELKDKERELARERERNREIRESKERELARERDQARERQAALEREAAKAKAAVVYSKDPAKQPATAAPTPAPANGTLPSYRAGVSKAE